MCRADFMVGGPALGFMLCCCHLEILSHFGTRGSGFHFANVEPVLPRSDLTQKLSLLPPTIHTPHSQALSRFPVNTLFRVGLTSRGEDEDLLWS